MSIKVELPARFGHTEEELAFIREMGVEYLNLNVMPENATLPQLREEANRLARFGLKISDLACPPLQKNADIILGRPEREQAVSQFADFVRLAGEVGAPLVSVAWQPNGIFRTGRGPGRNTRGGTAFFADLYEIEGRPISNDRVYDSDEIWDNFAWFLERILPVCEQTGVRLALHPNDPPVPTLGGVASLICSTMDYRRALALADGSWALGVKMCVGCWLEKPGFGNLLEDIREFQTNGQLVEVHFRNVSSPLPRFEETLSEDGYANMCDIMKTLVRCGFEGFCSIDHGFAGYPSTGGQLGSMAYPTGHMKGLLHAAEYELGLRG